MKQLPMVLGLLIFMGCAKPEKNGPAEGSAPAPDRGGTSANTGETLAEARKGFQSKLTGHKANEPLDVPPAKLFRSVKYRSAAGNLAAYLTPDPKDGKKHPAIVWITGGDCNSIGDVWGPTMPDNDQSARQYREAGIVMMFPSLRGGNQNPGVEEGFLGEVDDVLAAADFLAKQEYVDPKRIYLGGHSTGGTLVLLVAESTDRFRAVFSFGPVENVARYPPMFTPFNRNDAREIALRSPGNWLNCIEGPTFVFEGTEDGNLGSLQQMARSSRNPKVHFYPINGATHFTILAPTNRLIARKILLDQGATTNLSFTTAELNRHFAP